jgi:hypothetical protein
MSVTHMLLIDHESEQQTRILAKNMMDVAERYADRSYATSYRSIISFPSTRADLAHVGKWIKEEASVRGIKICVSPIKESDFFIEDGKLGLLACKLWQSFGTILLNDEPFSFLLSDTVLKMSDRFQFDSPYEAVLFKSGWFSINRHVCLMRAIPRTNARVKMLLEMGGRPYALSNIIHHLDKNCSCLRMTGVV